MTLQTIHVGSNFFKNLQIQPFFFFLFPQPFFMWAAIGRVFFSPIIYL